MSVTVSVITMSTPASTTASRSPGLFTVHVATASPCSWARPTSAALDLGVMGIDRRAPERNGGVEGVPGVERGVHEQRDRCGTGEAVEPGPQGGEGVGPERGHHDMGGPRPAGTGAVEEEGGDIGGHPFVGVVAGVGGNVLDLHVDDGPRARFEGLRQGGDPRRELRTPALVDEPRARDLGIVVHDELAVHAPPHVELHPVGAEPEGGREGVDGVLVPGPGPAPVREHRHRVLSPSQWPTHQGAP